MFLKHLGWIKKACFGAQGKFNQNPYNQQYCPRNEKCYCVGKYGGDNCSYSCFFVVFLVINND